MDDMKKLKEKIIIENKILAYANKLGLAMKTRNELMSMDANHCQLLHIENEIDKLQIRILNASCNYVCYCDKLD